jgi:23S rRNA (uridine2552-2'-O)-methyltransferase
VEYDIKNRVKKIKHKYMAKNKKSKVFSNARSSRTSNQKDKYYWRAKSEGYRSRASYKLIQINDKYNVIKKRSIVVDLGAAPGGWLQIARNLSDEKVIGVDLCKIALLDNVETIRGDITADVTIQKIMKKTNDKNVDVVICDAAPSLSGNWSLDHARSIDLSKSALSCAKKILKPGGDFVVKVFQGDMFKSIMDEIRLDFEFVRAFTPRASRSQSAEIYVIGKRFKL